MVTIASKKLTRKTDVLKTEARSYKVDSAGRFLDQVSV